MGLILWPLLNSVVPYLLNRHYRVLRLILPLSHTVTYCICTVAMFSIALNETGRRGKQLLVVVALETHPESLPVYSTFLYLVNRL